MMKQMPNMMGKGKRGGKFGNFKFLFNHIAVCAVK